MIANDMLFQRKLALIPWKNGLVLLYFCTLRRFQTFLCDFKRQILRKSMFFLANTNLGKVSIIASDMLFQKN